MARRLPPLTALRTFEAAARHLSFTRAAEELAVTQAAVSHQMRALEQWVGVPLFRRLHRSLQLTAPGQDYFLAVQAAFDALEQATARVSQADATSGTLTISTLPSFAAKWLVTRLAGFQARHPDISVRLQTSTGRTDFAREAVDVAIRFGRGPWPGLRSEPVLSEEIFPVCAPALMTGPAPLTEPAALRHHVLLHDTDEAMLDYEVSWRLWLEAAGVPGIDGTRGPRFSDAAILLQAAIAGQGVALARWSLVADDLSRGLLVRPFALSLPTPDAYWLVAPPHYFSRAKIRLFAAWLKEVAAAQTLPADPPHGDRAVAPGYSESPSS